jgi:hypothetical protein
MYCYQAYGLRIGSDRPLAGLLPAALPAEPDLHITFHPPALFVLPHAPVALLRASLDKDPQGQPAATVWHWRDARQVDFFQLRYSGGERWVEFTLDLPVARMWVAWAEGVAFADVAALLRGPVLAAVLWLRGITCLHASVVSLAERAVLLIGEPGAGKSTTAAAFAQAGHAILSDDVAAISETGGDFAVHPAHPALSLWSETAAHLTGRHDLPRIWTSVDKRSLQLETEGQASGLRFVEQSLPLAVVYFLGRRGAVTAPAIQPVAPAAGLLRLIANRYTLAELSAEHRARDFERLGRLARRVPLRQLDRPNALDRLPEVCAAVLADLAQLSVPVHPAALP